MADYRITDYTSLITAVARYLVRDDLSADIPLFIQLAEAEFNRSLRVRAMEARDYTTLVVGQEYYALPSDYQMARSMRLLTDPITFLQFRTPQQMDVLYPDASKNKPEVYAIIGNEFKIAPLPDTAYQMELVYYATIPALTSTATTNWLLADHPDIYLFATLLQAAPFLKEDDRLPVWTAAYSKVIQSLNDDSFTEEWNLSTATPVSDSYTP